MGSHATYDELKARLFERFPGKVAPQAKEYRARVRENDENPYAFTAEKQFLKPGVSSVTKICKG